MTPVQTPSADKPALILVIPQAALETIPASKLAGIRGCEAAYHRGKYYIAVPADVYRQWPKEAKEGVTPT